MLHFCPTFVFGKPLIPLLSILYLLPFPPHDRPLFLAVLLVHLLHPPPSESLRVFQWNVGGLQAKALNYFTFFRPILLTLSVSRNPILTPLPLSRFLDSLLCVLIAPTPGLTFSLLILCMLAAASSFLSGRAYLSLNFLLPLSLLNPYSDYVGVNISLKQLLTLIS